jgi:asparagine synthase (glutamine-hydrolysing)
MQSILDNPRSAIFDVQHMKPATPSSALTLGAPVFSDKRLTALAQKEGMTSAWFEAVKRHGKNAAQGVQGAFAVGLQDAAGRVFLAVDRFAQQTICYRTVQTASGLALRFSERADTLANLDGQTAEIDPQAIFDYLYFHCIPSPRTIFKGVYRLPAGHSAWFESGQLSVQPYATPQFDEPRSGNFDQLKDEFQSLLQQAVATQLDGSKAACFLSGGTDSSTVAGMIGRASKQQAATYSIGFEAQGYDEMAFARIAAKQFNTEHHEYYVTPDDLVRSIPQVAQHYDQPFGNSSALPAYYCARMAKMDGVSRLLAGDGGDELFGGNSRYAKQRVFAWYQTIPSPLRAWVVEPLFEKTPVGKLPLLKKGTSYIEQAKVPMPERLQMYNLLLRLGVQDVLTPAFLSQVNVHGPGEHQREVWSEVKNASDLNRTLAFDWRYTLGESDLPKVRETTRLANVAVGFPFLDDRLLDFSLRLPLHYKLKGLKLRWFFKEALRGFLPDEIITKKKQGFGLPFGVWLTRTPALRQLAESSLNSLAQRNIVRPAFIHALLNERLNEHPGYYGEMVWILMMLEQWLQRAAPGYAMK